MNSLRCVFVRVEHRFCVMAEDAARLAVPGWAVCATRFSSLSDALLTDPQAEAELLVLADAEPESLDRATEAKNALGLPRWSVVVLGEQEHRLGVEVVSSLDCTVPILTRCFRSALEHHRLRQDNARMIGDLRTVAHRVAHDLRNPLGAISSTGDLLIERLIEHDPSCAPLAKILTDAVADSERIVKRVSFLLHASTCHRALQQTEMAEVVRVVLERLEEKFLEKGVSVTATPSWPMVTGLPIWLQTVWADLLKNALDHATGATHVELGWRAEAQEFQFWVADDGAGVALERRPLLIRPFHLLHGLNDRHGLGLSIAQRLVELQGGRLGYEERSGRGSIFYFTLPAPSLGEMAH